MVEGFFAIATVTILGLMAGALLVEGAVLVPFWRSLPPDAFLRWYRDNGGLLLRFFGPLEVVAVLVTAVAALVSWYAEAPTTVPLVIAALLALTIVAMFPLYFKIVNESFAAGTVALEHVPRELTRWASWHWVRVALATAAFLLAILAARGSGPV